jgi:hypothetical protein
MKVPRLLEECRRLCTSPATGFLSIALLALRKIAKSRIDSGCCFKVGDRWSTLADENLKLSK